MKKSVRTDEYILSAEPFARPILEHLRQLVHDACPEAEEDFKWSFPVFMYKGRILCNMAAFKKHCAFGFWLAPQMSDPHGLLSENAGNAMGDMGKVSRLEELPSAEIIREYIREAMRLTEAGVVVPKKAAPKGELIIPPAFKKELAANTEARDHFMKMSPSQQREYVQWIAEAKQEATQNRRIQTAIEWISEGKGRHWKYEKK